MEKLAIEGGNPVRNSIIRYGHQWISDEDIAAVNEVLRSDFLTTGPKVEALQKKLCEYTGAKYAVVLSSGTAALHCACLAAGIKEGDEVITTPMTFAASANCALYCGAKPVFADINSETYNIDSESIRKCITNKTKAIVAVDFTGQPVDVDKIRTICNEYHLMFIEDAAHSIGSSYKGSKIGSLADMTTFSFHPVKTITGGEGGAVLTNDEALYHQLVLYFNHGINHSNEDLEEPHDEPWYYEQQYLGFNFRMTDFQAALVGSQLDRIEQFVARRQEIAARYNKAFEDIPEIILQKEIADVDICKHLYIIRLNLKRLKCTRLEFFNAMVAENVIPQVHYIPVYWFPYYRRLGYERGLCPNAEEVYEGIMSISLYPQMTNQDVESVIHAVKKVIGNFRL